MPFVVYSAPFGSRLTAANLFFHFRKRIPGFDDSVKRILLRFYDGFIFGDEVACRLFTFAAPHNDEEAVAAADAVLDHLVAAVDDAVVDDIEHPVGTLSRRAFCPRSCNTAPNVRERSAQSFFKA